MTSIKTKLTAVVLLFLAPWVYSADLTNCRTIKIDRAIVKLSTKKPTVVLIHNISTAELWITHPSEGTGMQAGWSSALSPKRWSALALDKKNFAIQCIESTPGHEQQVPCQGLLHICQWSKVNKRHKGTYWAVENKPLKTLMRDLATKGFERSTNQDL